MERLPDDCQEVAAVSDNPEMGLVGSSAFSVAPGLRPDVQPRSPLHSQLYNSAMTSSSEQSVRKGASPCTLRPHRPGDLGWIVHRQGKLYAEEHGYNERFEGVVAGIAADFLRAHDPQRERCWIAEIDGEPVGHIMLVKRSEDVAKLRVMLVEPAARGHGVGAALVAECVRFAREAGYRKITLWTHSNLVAARRLYERTGFRLVHSEPAAEGFGRELVDETWELEL